MDQVALTFQPEARDHVAAQRLYDRHSRWAVADRVVAVLLALVGAVSTTAVGARWWTLVWFPLALLEWFHLLTVRPLLARLWFRQNPKFRETYHLVFDDSGIQFRTASIDSRVAWSHYHRALEDANVWLLVYGPRMYTVLPKRAFTAESEQAFRALLARNLTAQTRSNA